MHFPLRPDAINKFHCIKGLLSHALPLTLPPSLHPLRQLYDMGQMFPDAASKALRGVLADGSHAMEEELEGSGRGAAFPALDMVRPGPPFLVVLQFPWRPTL